VIFNDVASLGIETKKRRNYYRELGHDFEKGRLLVLLDLEEGSNYTI
jgi:hypothetical protein